MIDLVRKAFAESGLSMRSLALQANVSYASVYGIIAGNQNPQVFTLEKLAKVLNLELRPINTNSGS